VDWTLTDVESVARGRLSQLAYDYAAGGAGEERTLADNVDAFRRRTLVPRFLVDVSTRDLTTRLLGKTYPMPIGVAPTAFHKLFHEDGERGVARACAARGVLHCVSTLATTRAEEIAQEGSQRWFQVYVHKDRELTRELVEGAKASGYEALVLTVDAPVWAIRERDRRNRFTLPPPLRLANFDRRLPNASMDGPDGLQSYVNAQFDPSLTWADVEWLKGFGLPVLVKGILDAEDAKLAVDHGCAGVIVSNHGARMLDRVPATLDALGDIVDAVGGRVPVVMDGGVRRGVDALIALASGADFVMVGRPVVWGLAAGGEAGVGRVLDLLRGELDNAMALTGCRTLADARQRSAR
jgi:4-hydroxymandelate oxidase